MNADNICNIGILAHVDAGKTTLTEQFLLSSGAIRKAGSVDSGTTQTDWLPIERERGISVRAAQTTFFWKERQINLIDTPGHIDFAGEVERSLLAMDLAVLMVSAVEGIQSHTENLWNALTRLSMPTLIVLNKIDRAGSHAKELIDSIPEELHTSCKLLPLNHAIREGFADFDIADNDLYSVTTVELLADVNDEIAELYLMGEEIPRDMLLKALRDAIADRKVIPVLSVCAAKGLGTEKVLDTIVDLFPTAARKEVSDLSALVFKIEHDKTMGKVAHVRMFGGSLESRDLVTLNPDLPGEKISQVRKFNGQKYLDVGKVTSGDIAALCGLSTSKVFDVIGSYELSDKYKLANPFLSVKATPENEAELTPLVSALRELSDEDPLLHFRWNKSENEINLSVTGKIQLEVLSSLLAERYNLKATFSEPTVIYKETPSKSGFGFDAYTMPKPCWAMVNFRFDPLPRGSGVQYDGGKIPSNTCFYKYQDHIRKSFFANLEQGMLGWEVTDFKATLVGAEHHTIHTHPLDFFVCTPMAIMDGLRNTGTTLLEPFIKARITAPADVLGKVIGDITNMRGTFESPMMRGDSFTMEASLPVATSMEYPIRLAALTHGKGILFSSFDGYRDCPLSLGATAKRIGPNPLDRAQWILYARGAMQDENYHIM